MKLTLLISDNCAACERARGTIEKIKLNNPHLLIEIIHINFYNDKRISITPALLVNNQLFSYGDIDESRLLMQLNSAFSQSHQKN